MKKVLFLCLSMILIIGSLGLGFANDPKDIDDWRGNSNLLNEADKSVKDVGRAVDNLVMTIGKIVASIGITIVGIKKMSSGKNAQNKFDLKEDLLKLVLGSTFVFFGVEFLIKIVTLIGNAFFK